MGQQMPCRQVLNFPTAQAALYELFSNRFFRLRHQISSRVFLLGLSWRHIGFWFRYRILSCLNLCRLGNILNHISFGKFTVGLNKTSLENCKLLKDKIERLFRIPLHNQFQQF